MNYLTDKKYNMPVMSHDDSLVVIEGINNVIKNSGIDTNKVSDGYHTFAELYEHRIVLFMTLCKELQLTDDASCAPAKYNVWRSKKHSDGTEWDGWFIMGIFLESGKQITYHMPIIKWEDAGFCDTLEKAPEWDGHTSNDVLERLKQL
jgi:hypothetical protein